MSQELLYTSAEQGLKPGSRGFCTVVCTQGMPATLMERLEGLSAYRHAFRAGDPQAQLNPVNYSHLRILADGRRLHILSRISDAPQDYSHRSNKLAHHVALETSELIEAGPARVLAQPGFCETAWNGTPRMLPAGRVPHAPPSRPAVCQTWARYSGDAGWAGWLAEKTLENPNQPISIIYAPGTDTLALVKEAMDLLPPEQRWQITFSTYFTQQLETLVDQCHWRFVLDDPNPKAREAPTLRQNSRALLIDLTAPRRQAPDGDLAQQARTGIAPAPVVGKPPALPPGRPPGPPGPPSRMNGPQRVSRVEPEDALETYALQQEAETGAARRHAAMPAYQPRTAPLRPPAPPQRLSMWAALPTATKFTVYFFAVLLLVGGGVFVGQRSKPAPSAGEEKQTVSTDQTGNQPIVGDPVATQAAGPGVLPHPSETAKPETPTTTPPTTPTTPVVNTPPAPMPEPGAPQQPKPNQEVAAVTPENKKPEPPKETPEEREKKRLRKAFNKLNERNRRYALPPGPKDLSEWKLELPGMKAEDCTLELLGAKKNADDDLYFLLDAAPEDTQSPTRIWEVSSCVKEKPNAASPAMPIGKFTLTQAEGADAGCTLSFAWNESLSSMSVSGAKLTDGEHCLRLRFTALKIKNKNEEAICFLSEAPSETPAPEKDDTYELRPSTTPNLWPPPATQQLVIQLPKLDGYRFEKETITLNANTKNKELTEEVEIKILKNGESPENWDKRYFRSLLKLTFKPGNRESAVSWELFYYQPEYKTSGASVQVYKVASDGSRAKWTTSNWEKEQQDLVAKSKHVGTKYDSETLRAKEKKDKEAQFPGQTKTKNELDKEFAAIDAELKADGLSKQQQSLERGFPSITLQYTISDHNEPITLLERKSP